MIKDLIYRRVAHFVPSPETPLVEIEIKLDAIRSLPMTGVRCVKCCRATEINLRLDCSIEELVETLLSSGWSQDGVCPRCNKEREHEV